MQNLEPLIVYFEDSIVGIINPNENGNLSFQYSPEWLSKKENSSISYSLPLREELFSPVEAHPFFTNLLPEGNVRTQLAYTLNLSETSDYMLLKAIGGECAGALQIYPEKDGPPFLEDSPEQERILDNETIYKMIQQNSIVGAYSSSEFPLRLSLAGAQHKIPVLWEAGSSNILITSGVRPSTHILKIPNRDFKHLPENEAYLNLVAIESGLNVPESFLLRVTGNNQQYIFLSNRYDRLQKDNQIKRIHQEDFCQASSVPPHRKYEKEGGPTLKSILQIIRDVSTNPLHDSDQFLSWIVFNLICGNADAHGKNISLLYTGEGPRLAPFYDLVSTKIYPTLDKKLAMSIGGRNDPGQIGKKNWLTLAGELDIGGNFLLKKVDATLQATVEAADRALDQFHSTFGKNELINQIRLEIHRQASRSTHLLH